ncbi:MAG: hypothetical protein LBJ32_00070, partial [Oscillospiraceae bacterium]|nr:hypothetical protein [Oscillospiraceae bacterium]
MCKNLECKHKTFYADYKYNAWKPNVKQKILNWSVDGAGTRAISRQLKVHR